MRLIPVSALLAAALFSAVVSLPFMPFAASTKAVFRFEVEVTSSQRGVAQLFYDVGHGLREEDSAHAPVDGNSVKQLLRFDLPAGHYTALRFDPLDRGSSITLAGSVIRDSAGTIVHRFAAIDFKPDHDVSAVAPQPDGSLKLELPPSSTDPITIISLPAPLNLRPDYGNLGPALRRITLPIFAIVVALLFAFGRIPVAALQKTRVRLTALASKPGRAVALTAALAVAASSYPVLFLGKSFVSPNFGTVLLYEAFPTLPGYRDARVEDVKAADVGALMWAHIPLSVLESRALSRDHQLPLWNRYNSMGTPLLGQGQSMFGDPLHFLVLASGGAAWAWDVKFLFAKWLLAAGVGLCVLRATRHLPAAAIVAAVMPFIGYFIYRVNHPAIFSMCYAPWILLAWIGIVDATHWRGVAAWVGGLMLANWTEMNSGTVKEAYMSLLTLNFVGVVALLVAALPRFERMRRFALATAGGLILALLAAPVWLTFLDALAKSYTGYNDPRAYQVQPSLALAFFDEILFRPFFEQEKVYNGSVNFVVLLGLLAFLVNLRRICAGRLALGLTLASLLPLAIIFGVIPPGWIVKIPFLGNVVHLDNSFFCPMITLLGVFAGFGFRAAAQRLGQPEGRGDLALGGLLLAALVAQYLAFGHTVQRSTYSYWHWGEQIVRSRFVTGSFIALIVATVAFGLVARWVLVRGRVSAGSALTLATCAIVMLWRFGLHGQTGYADYVLAPPPRANFDAASPVIAAARADRRGEPWRFVGLNGNAFHGWMNVYDFEGICGPDALVNQQVRELQDGLGLERIWDWRIYSQFSTLAVQKRAYDFLNVRHYFDYNSDQGRLGAILSPVKMADLDLYRSDTAWPRAFFTDQLAVYDNPKDLGKLVNEGDGRPFAAMQRSDPTPSALPPSNLTGRTVTPAKNYLLTTNTTAFDIDVAVPGLVVLQETWSRKDFRARLDGKSVPYLRVNHAFKGILVAAPGTHHVEFEYWPRRFTESLVLSGTGFAALLGAVWFVRRKSRG